MNKEAKKTLMQIGELVSAEKHDSKQKFMGVKDGIVWACPNLIHFPGIRQH